VLWIWICLAFLIIAPAFCAVKLGGRWRWMFLGIGSWMLGLMAKNALFYLLDWSGDAYWPHVARAVVVGTLSASCELGAAAVFLRRPVITLIDAVGFGAAIGSFEVIFTLSLGLLEGLGENLQWVAPPLGFVNGTFLFERILALAGHTASRVLVFIALQRKQWLPGAIALLTFSSIDGLAAYGVAAEWNWEDAAISFRFQITEAAIALLEAAAAVWSVRRHFSLVQSI